MYQMEIDLTARRNKIIGIAVSAIFHAVLLLLFLFMGLSYQVPPPPEYGIEVDMGGGGGSSGSRATASTPHTPSDESVATQNAEDVGVTAAPTKTDNPKPTTSPTNTDNTVTTPVETPTINTGALYPGKTNKGGTGTDGSGTDGKGSGSVGDGDYGDGQGDKNGRGIGNTGGDFYLKGRPVINKAFPSSKNNLEGIVQVEFRADRNGNVIYAKAGGRGTTIHNAQIWEECEKAALKSKFKAKSDAEIEERGTITYRFVVQ